MEYYSVFVILFCVFVSGDCKTLSENGGEEINEGLNRVKRETHKKLRQDVVVIPTYAIYMIGFIMIIMLLAIIGLSIALYLVRKNKHLFGRNADTKQYVRQESTGVIPLYNSNYDEQNKNNGSTLTVNSGVIEISEPRLSEPETPVRLEDSKIVFTKKPINPIVPVMPRGQMDAICKEVLKRVQKSDSASFRDLNELLNAKHDEKIEEKCEIVEESQKEIKEEENIGSKIQAFENKEAHKPKQEKDVTAKTEPENENREKPESKVVIEKDKIQETENKPTNEIENKLQPEVKNELTTEVPKLEIDKSAEVSDTETEYDTVPSPIPYRHSGPEVENFETDNGFQLYDLPPRRSHEGVNRNVILMDQDSQYLLAISTENIDSCYVNAKTPQLN